MYLAQAAIGGIAVDVERHAGVDPACDHGRLVDPGYLFGRRRFDELTRLDFTRERAFQTGAGDGALFEHTRVFGPVVGMVVLRVLLGNERRNALRNALTVLVRYDHDATERDLAAVRVRQLEERF